MDQRAPRLRRYLGEQHVGFDIGPGIDLLVPGHRAIRATQSATRPYYRHASRQGATQLDGIRPAEFDPIHRRKCRRRFQRADHGSASTVGVFIDPHEDPAPFQRL